MKRRIFIYLYLAVFVYENKSETVSSGMSIEDSLSTYDETEVPISIKEEMTKEDSYKISGDFRTNDSIELDKFNNNFNPHADVMNHQKNQPNFERNAFRNSTKSYKKTTRPRKENKHPRFTRKKKIRLHKITKPNVSSDFLVNNKVKRLNPLETKKNVVRQDVSDEFSISNLKYLWNVTEAKSSNEYEKADTISKIQNNIESKYSKLNKPGNLGNLMILRKQEIFLSEGKNGKNFYSEIPLENKKFNIALERANQILKEQQYETQNRKVMHNIRLPLATGFDTSKTEMITELSTTEKKNEISKPHKDRFTLTILDIDENPAQYSAKELPSNQVSPILRIDEPKKMSPMSKAFEDIEINRLRSTLKPYLIAQQLPTDTETIDKNEKEPYGRKVKIPGIKSNAPTKDIPVNVLNVIKSRSTVLFDYKNNVNLNMKYNPSTVMERPSKILVGRNNFDVPLNKYDIQYKNRKKGEKVDLSNDFSNAEMTRIDSNESDEKSGDECVNVSRIEDSESIKYIQRNKIMGNILRRSKQGIKCKKTLSKCQKACIQAYTSFCERSKCSPKVKRYIKYQCKKSCEKTFGRRVYSSE